MTNSPFRPDGPRLDPSERRQLLLIFREEAGLEFPMDTEFVIERKLQERLAENHLGSFEEYIKLLRTPAGRRELEAALDEVTTHETYFFREEFQLKAFHDELLPRLRALTESRRRLTVWSAGCSTGEEVYTLAMLINESRLFEGWAVRIVGSDLSRRCVHTARRAVYGRSSFRAVPKELLGRYFVEEEAGRMRVIDEIRNQCLFVHANLLDFERHLTLGRMEAVFCRNVLIYLAEEARGQVLQTLYDRLAPGGYLMLGHSESLLHSDSSFEVVHLRGDVVYRRPERDEVRRPHDNGKPR